MFELYFQTEANNVEFLRQEGRAVFTLIAPVYLPMGEWSVSVLKLICNHATPSKYTGAVYLESNIVQTKLINGYARQILSVSPAVNRNKTCFCDSPANLSFCDLAVTEISQFMLDFRTGANDYVSFDDKFQFCIVLCFKKK